MATLTSALAEFLTRSAIAYLRREKIQPSDYGRQIASVFETLGGGWLKVGQVLSTRTDILSESLARPLQRLQDSLTPISSDKARSVIEQSLHTSTADIFVEFDPRPIGSATIAQVHRAILRDSGTAVAVKIRRPGIDRLIRTDSRIVLLLSRLLSILPPFRGLPLIEAIEQVTQAIQAQTNFELEAELHRQIFSLFENGTPVRVPRLLDEYCTSEVIVMEYFPNMVKITAPELDDRIHKRAVTAGLQALYKMLFIGGIVHCDIHPGNVLVNQDGIVLLLDFGFATVIPPAKRAAFAEFFLCIALNNQSAAARIVLETALRVPADLNRAAFEGEIGKLLSRFSGRRAGEFLIAAFVSSLFTIQRKYRVYGSPSFTLAILSLMVYEGIIRSRCADLDFQKEAIPTLLSALHK